MMQEVANDSNGESTFDFMADAKPPSDIPDNASLTHSFSSSSSGVITPTVNPAVQPPSFGGSTNLQSTPKPSYEFPPGMAPSVGLPRVPSAATMFPPPSFRPPGPTPSVPFTRGMMPPTFQSPGGMGSFPPAKSAGPDLNEIFGAEVMANLPPMNVGQNTPSSSPSKFPSPLYQVSANRNQPQNPPAFMPSFQPPAPLPPHLTAPPTQPPKMSPLSSSSAGVNPFSSQAAGSHLPSFSGLASSFPNPAGAPTLPPSTFTPFPPAPVSSSAAAPPPVAMFSVPQNALPSLPQLGAMASYPSRPFPSDNSLNYQPPAVGYDQSQNNYPGNNAGMSVSMGAQTYPSSNYGQSHSANRSWWAQASMDTLKNVTGIVTEKAKSTVSSLMTVLDPQMKPFAGDESAGATGDLTMFYIGNDLHMIETLKSGLSPLYAGLHIYTRSGAAPGHKLQIGFANALNTAHTTLQLALSAPAIQQSVLLAVEPFVVEATPNCWYTSSCLVLNDASKGASLQIFSQLTPLPEGLLQLPAGEQNLPVPLEEIILRSMPMAGRDTWMDWMTGVSYHATVALAARQLFGIYKRRYP